MRVSGQPCSVVGTSLSGPLGSSGQVLVRGIRCTSECPQPFWYSACHATKAGQEGAAPSLYGVVGRVSGTESGFSYTPAIKSAHIAWTPAKLDAFLSGPAKLVPGTAMPITLADPAQRHDVIAYLASLKK